MDSDAFDAIENVEDDLCEVDEGSPEANSLEHVNYPIVCEKYKDPESQLEKVIVAISLPGGSQCVRVDVQEDGKSITIKYNWTKPMYVVEELFKPNLAKNDFEVYHPKILAIQRGLESHRKKIDSTPQGELRIKLPIKVQTSPLTHSKSGIMKKDGTLITIIELTGYAKEYNSKVVDATVTFNVI